MEQKRFPFEAKQDKLLAGVVEGYAAVFGNVDDGNDVIDVGAFTKTIAENGGRIKMGWQHEAPFGVTTYIAEVPREALPPSVLERAPDATGGLFVRGQADMTAEDADRLKRLASGSVDEMSIGFETIKANFEQSGDQYVRRLKEVRLFEWSPVWIAMNQAARVTGIKAASELEQKADELDRFMTVVAELKEGRVLSAASKTKIDAAMAAAKELIKELETLLAAAEPAPKGHSTLHEETRLQILQADVDGLILRARMAGAL
jgi:uncharacterized protein